MAILRFTINYGVPVRIGCLFIFFLAVPDFEIKSNRKLGVYGMNGLIAQMTRSV